MNILYYDCFAGISGDMNLGAMIDLGVEPDYLKRELGRLGLDHAFELVITPTARNGIRGTRVDVQLAGQGHGCGCRHGHGADSSEGGHAHPSSFRTFADVREIIEGSTLPDVVRETSLRIFRKLAEAEGKVHGKPMDAVHFHEVGATDSLVDIVGAAICRHRLDVDAVWASPVELGSGIAHCVHGAMPVPAPATVEILNGIPTLRGGTDHEATTPTGAAILTGLVDDFVENPAMTTCRTGYGIGHRDAALPNLLRVHLAEAAAPLRPATRRACLLQCNIDDMTGEMLGNVMELLLEKGAMDVHFSAIAMKKNRPATMISLLCGEGEVARFQELLFRHTSTLGIKLFPLEKVELERRFDTVETSLGRVTVKRALLNGEVLRSKPEFEECRAIARQNGIPLAEVYALIGRNE